MTLVIKHPVILKNRHSGCVFPEKVYILIVSHAYIQNTPARVMINMSHFVLQEFCWFSEKDALETDVLPSTVTTTAVKARHVTCGKTSLWTTDINCIYLSFKQKITLSTDLERLTCCY